MSRKVAYGLDSVEREERFRAKLAMLASLSPEAKRKRMKRAEYSDSQPLERHYRRGCGFTQDGMDMTYHGRCFQ